MKTTAWRIALAFSLCGALGAAPWAAAAESLDPDSLEFTPGVAVTEGTEGSQSQFGLDVTSLRVTTDRWQKWVDLPGGDQASVWKWTPHVDFVVRGPLAGRGQLYCDWYMPDGRGWIRSSFRTPVLSTGAFLRCETAREGMDQLAISQAGLFAFDIGLMQKDQADVVVFKGRAKIGRFHVGNNLPKFKDQFCYYVDQDWMLPCGWLYTPTAHMATSGEMLSPLDESELCFACWFARPESGLQVLRAHLYCDGREIVLPNVAPPALTTSSTGAGWEGGEQHAYTRCEVRFYGVIGMARDPAAVEEPLRYLLARHPGAYEVRLVLQGQTVRSARFVVGQDGRVVDQTDAWKQKLGSPRMVVPVAVTGSADRAWNKAAWPAEAFWGNPLAGFSGPG